MAIIYKASNIASIDEGCYLNTQEPNPAFVKLFMFILMIIPELACKQCCITHLKLAVEA
jgi:hypothetical protein